MAYNETLAKQLVVIRANKAGYKIKESDVDLSNGVTFRSSVGEVNCVISHGSRGNTRYFSFKEEFGGDIVDF